MRGAGGTEGGIGRFLLGCLMMLIGGYLFFNAITVTQHFHMGYSLYSFGGFSITSGILLIPFILGVGIIFYDAKQIAGWVLSVGSLVLIVVGVLASIQFRMQHLSVFELILILVLFVGGVGLFLNSLKTLRQV